jgi:hypothetical protein
MSSNRKPAFGWIGIEGVYKAIEEIKIVIREQTKDQRKAFYTENLPIQSDLKKKNSKFE